MHSEISELVPVGQWNSKPADLHNVYKINIGAVIRYACPFMMVRSRRVRYKLCILVRDVGEHPKSLVWGHS